MMNPRKLHSTNPCGRLPGTRVLLCALLLFCLGLLQGCSATDVPDADGWFASADGLARGIAGALSAHDREALDRFGISRDEYMRLVWPELPVSKIEQWKKQSEFVWRQHAAKSDSGLRKVLAKFGGSSLTAGQVRFTRPAQEYPSFRLHVRPAITLADSSGAELGVPVPGTIIEHAGRFKVFSYSIKD